MSKDKINKALKDMQKKREQLANQIGVFIEAEAKLRTPVKTGNLRRNITHSVESDDKKSVVNVGTNVEYAPVIELGSVSKNIQAQPFLQPSIGENIESIQKMIQKGLSLK